MSWDIYMLPAAYFTDHIHPYMNSQWTAIYLNIKDGLSANKLLLSLMRSFLLFRQLAD
jgi:hypothetical protein